MNDRFPRIDIPEGKVLSIKTGQRMSIEEFKKLGHTGKGQQTRHVRGQMNKTEEAFSELAETHKQAGLIWDWWFESITLLLAPDMRYTPDFMVLELDSSISLVEVKPSYTDKETGQRKPYARDGSLDRLKVAAAKFPFRFKLAVRQTGTNFVITEVK